MHKPQSNVRQLHREVIGAPSSPAEPKIRNGMLRSRLILEEALETVVALVGSSKAIAILSDALDTHRAEHRTKEQHPNLAEAIDGIVDTIVVCYGTAEDIGVDLEPFWDEVHRSNMAKKDGPRRPDGKLLKPPGWQPPNIEKVLAEVCAQQSIKRAAVAIVEDRLGRLLCVWNKRYNGWSLPGGKVEDGETPAEAAIRELREETGLRARSLYSVFAAAHGAKVDSTRGSLVHVFRAYVEPGEPTGAEEGCPVQWMGRREFLAESPFAEFYEQVFKLPEFR